jgi:serine protease Do
MKSPRLAAFLLIALSFLAPAPAQAQSFSDFLRTNPKFVQNFRDVVAGPGHSTVRVKNDGKDVALGVIVDKDGLILTKAFDLTGTVVVTLGDGRELEAQIVGMHKVHDLALLKIDAGDLPAIQFKPSKKLPVGSWVASVGTGVDPASIGVVSVPTRDVAFKGLPLASSELAKVGYLGVAVETADGAGVRVLEVVKNTAAAKAGLHVDDVILRVADVKIGDPEQFQTELVKHKPGESVNLRVRRGDDELLIDATLQQRPAGDNRGEFQNLMGSDLSPRRSGYPTILTHDSVVKPADCGGPLVDLDGNVIGINISRAGRTESWAIPSEVIEAVLPELRSGRLAPSSRPRREP